MTGDRGSIEGVLSMAGVAAAAALIMLVVLALTRSAGSADVAIGLRAAADEVSGDIGIVAASAMPCCHNVTCPMAGINITPDFVIADAGPGQSFARPLAVRVYPGNYCGADGARWNGTGDLRSLLVEKYGSDGTRSGPLSPENGSRVAALLEEAGREMLRFPMAVAAGAPLTVEKLFVYVSNRSGGGEECEPYVFVYQR